MRLSRALSGLLPSSSSQAGKWLPLQSAAALQASLSTAAAPKRASRKSTRAAGDPPQRPEASTESVPSEEKGEHGVSPRQAPAEVVEEGAPPRLPKPSEIPWQAKVANSVHLIGHLGAPIHLGASADGAYTAATILLHEKTHDLPQFWVPIVFQGDLAQIAACNLREKDHVYVTGQLTGGSQLIDDNAETKMQVMVHNISYVLELHPEKTNDRNSERLDSASAEVEDAPFTMELWNDLFANPHKWWDYRLKGNKKSGTFKHKDTGQLLEINESTPEWVLSKLDTFVFSSTTSSINSQSANAEKSRESVVGYWSDLLENPHLWWDNRESKQNGKVNPKFPDFSHKTTRQALWLDSAPDWVLPKLESVVVSAKARWQSEAKKTITVLAKKANAGKSRESVVGYWSDLLENPHLWWDNRENKQNGKVNPKLPDFSHKTTRQALWLDSAPDWVLPKLESAVVSAKARWQSEAKKTSTVLAKKEESWRNLMENPNKWWDKRSNKSKTNAPDFKHKETGEALWLKSSSTPKWALDKFPPTNTGNQL